MLNGPFRAALRVGSLHLGLRPRLTESTFQVGKRSPYDSAPPLMIDKKLGRDQEFYCDAFFAIQIRVNNSYNSGSASCSSARLKGKKSLTPKNDSVISAKNSL
jgi:hypothetical protein